MFVFHKIGTPNRETFTNSIEQILECDEISFDGAYRSVWEHREQLKDKEPILFVQGETVGDEGVCTMDEIRELANDYKFILGWHGWSHRKLTELPDHTVIKELTAPHEFCKLYAFPHGSAMYNVELAKRFGYKHSGNEHPEEDHQLFYKMIHKGKASLHIIEQPLLNYRWRHRLNFNK